LGLVKVNFFYVEFGINIFHFIHLSEILLSFIPVLIVLFVSIATYVVVTFILGGSMTAGPVVGNQEIRDSKFWKRILYASINAIPSAIQIWAISGVNAARMYYREQTVLDGYWTTTLFISVGVILLYILLSIISYRTEKDRALEGKLHPIWMIIFAALLLGAAGWFGTNEANQLKNQNATKGVVIHLSDGVSIHSNENLYYIGKTDSYLFIYSELNKTTEVIPIERIKGITFPVK
jgi:hypothetical protein